jgi:hypothetical protein
MFDLSIIAIMLGRLHMTLEECKKAYIQLSKTIFTAKHPTSKVIRKPYDMWNVNSKFDSTALEAAIKTEIWGKLPRTAKPEDELLNDPDESCKVYGLNVALMELKLISNLLYYI